jgi:hypothetical protein
MANRPFNGWGIEDLRLDKKSAATLYRKSRRRDRPAGARHAILACPPSRNNEFGAWGG